MRQWQKAALAIACSLTACGGATDPLFEAHVPSGAPPIIQRIAPTTAASGDELTVFGVGFSVVPAENVLHIGEATVVASEYAVVASGAEGEAEALTFMVPPQVVVGEHTVFVTVLANASNANVELTITP